METLVQRLVAESRTIKKRLRMRIRREQLTRGRTRRSLERVGMTTQDPALREPLAQRSSERVGRDIGRCAPCGADPDGGDRQRPDPTDRGRSSWRSSIGIAARSRGLAALLERRAKALTPYITTAAPRCAAHVAGMYEELGRLWTDRAARLTPQEGARALSPRDRDRAVAVSTRSTPPARSTSRCSSGRTRSRSSTWSRRWSKIRSARSRSIVTKRRFAPKREIEAAPPKCCATRAPTRRKTRALMQELGVHDRRPRQSPVSECPTEEREEAAQIFVSMAETYGGEHGDGVHAWRRSTRQPGHDRAIQLAGVFWKADRTRRRRCPSRWTAYLNCQPQWRAGRPKCVRSSLPPDRKVQCLRKRRRQLRPARQQAAPPAAEQLASAPESHRPPAESVGCAR